MNFDIRGFPKSLKKSPRILRIQEKAQIGAFNEYTLLEICCIDTGRHAINAESAGVVSGE